MDFEFDFKIDSWKYKAVKKLHLYRPIFALDKNVNKNVINVILDKTIEVGDKNVEKVIKILEEKYSKTTIEKTNKILKEILEFEMMKYLKNIGTDVK